MLRNRTETEDINDLDLREEPQDVCGELEVFVEFFLRFGEIIDRQGF